VRKALRPFFACGGLGIAYAAVDAEQAISFTRLERRSASETFRRMQRRSGAVVRPAAAATAFSITNKPAQLPLSAPFHLWRKRTPAFPDKSGRGGKLAGINGTTHTKESSMRGLLLSVAALGGLALFATAATAQSPYYYDHDRYHDQLEHRAFHRYLEHQDAHRYPMTWRDHEQLHDELNHQAFHDRLEHREYHRQYYYVPSYSYGSSYYAPYIPYGSSYSAPYQGYGASNYGPYGSSYYAPYQGYGASGFGYGIQGPRFSLYFGR
jgi:hypothetical protein